MIVIVIQQIFLYLNLVLSGSAAVNKYCPDIHFNDYDFVAYIKQGRLKKYPALPVSITVDGRTFKLKEGQYPEGSKMGYQLSSVTYQSTDKTISFDIIFVDKEVKSVVIDGALVVESFELLKIYESNRFFTMDDKMEAYEQKVAALKLYIQEQSESLATASVLSLEKCTLSSTPKKPALSFDSPVQSLCFETPPTQKGYKKNANPDLSPRRCLSFD
uniref:Uncharacterized protein n=1 Tax=viral metagenome TaxID=1070528 RepID=A0A6C0BFG7_9ZZZZ